MTAAAPDPSLEAIFGMKLSGIKLSETEKRRSPRGLKQPKAQNSGILHPGPYRHITSDSSP